MVWVQKKEESIGHKSQEEAKAIRPMIDKGKIILP